MKTLEEIRTERGVTKAALAKHLGISRPTYDEYEENPQRMRIETAKAVADFLHVSVADIFFLSNGK